jgi:hypothetical protein
VESGCSAVFVDDAAEVEGAKIPICTGGLALLFGVGASTVAFSLLYIGLCRFLGHSSQSHEVGLPQSPGRTLSLSGTCKYRTSKG